MFIVEKGTRALGGPQARQARLALLRHPPSWCLTAAACRREPAGEEGRGFDSIMPQLPDERMRSGRCDRRERQALEITLEYREGPQGFGAPLWTSRRSASGLAMLAAKVEAAGSSSGTRRRSTPRGRTAEEVSMVKAYCGSW